MEKWKTKPVLPEIGITCLKGKNVLYQNNFFLSIFSGRRDTNLFLFEKKILLLLMRDTATKRIISLVIWSPPPSPPHPPPPPPPPPLPPTSPPQK